MNSDLVMLPSVPTVKEVIDALNTGHPSFPVYNRNAQLVGKVPANFLIVLIEQRAWYRLSFDEKQTSLNIMPQMGDGFEFDENSPTEIKEDDVSDLSKPSRIVSQKTAKSGMQ